MVIWEYKVPVGADGVASSEGLAYGCPIDVFVPDLGHMQAVYQFAAPDQQCAVVHHASGRIICHIPRELRNQAPQMQAQAAINALATRIKPGSFKATLEAAPVLNRIPRVVGMMPATIGDIHAT